MGFTTESMPVAPTARMLEEPAQFDLPVKEFVGYDPKGTTTITGSPLVQKTKTVSTEATAEEAPEVAAAPEESVTLSAKVSAIARRDQAQRAKERQIIEREKSLAEKLAKAEKYEQLTAKLAAKDYSAVDELGINYEEIVKHELNKEAAKNPEQERVRQLEEKLQALEKAREEDSVKEYQANQALWKEAIVKAVTENEDFSTIKALAAEDIVLKHINDSFEEDGVELTVEQAAKEIEDALLERADKFSSVPKLKNKVPDAKVLGAPKTSVKTITQNMTTTPKTVVSKPFHLMSESEQIAEAIRRVQAAKLQR
jgi:hypothetical protein